MSHILSKYKILGLFLGISLIATISIVNASSVSEATAGRILLQVEENGEAWYVEPGSEERLYLGRPADAWGVMRSVGLGVKHTELMGYLNAGFPERLSGMIVLDVENHGEAYYVLPTDLKGYYLGTPDDAFGVMRSLGLGVSNRDLESIRIANDSVAVPSSASSTASSESETETSDSVPDSAIDLTKLPLGDDKYASAPKKGYVYSCQTSFTGGGAETQGPWIDAENNTWDATIKSEVDGNVSWINAKWTEDATSGKRILTSTNLPINHTTGTYPIASSDDAYLYDRNPNSIAQQALTLSLPLVPTLLSSPHCVGGEVGIALSGVLIFNAFDAGGRDAVATEVQDHCDGHPQEGGYYHYHGYSDCFQDTATESGHDHEHSELLGYAYDGFGIYGTQGEDGQELSSDDLDECHGETHTITWDGVETEMYHYHFTKDFPYTVSCFRGEPAVTGLSSNGSSSTSMPSGMRPPPPR